MGRVELDIGQPSNPDIKLYAQSNAKIQPQYEALCIVKWQAQFAEVWCWAVDRRVVVAMKADKHSWTQVWVICLFLGVRGYSDPRCLRLVHAI